MYCLTLEPSHEKRIIDLNYIPVGLGTKKFSNNFLSDKTGDNISEKNSYYGEYTFHYWIWKNYLEKIETEWVGFCQYRKFFVSEKVDEKKISFRHLNDISIKIIKDRHFVHHKLLSLISTLLNLVIINTIRRLTINPKIPACIPQFVKVSTR